MDFSRFGKPSDEWLEFIKANPRTPDPAITDPKANRQHWLATGVWKPIPPSLASQVTIKNVSIPTTSDGSGTSLPCRLYYPLSRPFARSHLPLYYYIHGGGFLHGALDADDYNCSRICASLCVVVCHVEYRHTDVGPWPLQHEDAWKGFKYAIEKCEEWGTDAESVFVSGESAGATLGLGVCLRAAKEGIPIKAQLLGSPFLCRPSFFPDSQIAEGKKSLKEFADQPGPTTQNLEWFMDLLDPTRDPTNYDANPLLRPLSELKVMPRTYIQIAGMDPLRDEGLLYVQRLKDAGVHVTETTYAGVPHAFHHTDALEVSTRCDADHDREVNEILGR